MDRAEVRVLAIDPGATCGMATKERAWESPQAVCLRYLEVAMEIQTLDRVAIERFSMRQHTVDAENTLMLIGALLYVARNLPIGWVNPSDKKAVADLVPEHLRDHAWDAEAVRLWDLRYGKW